MDIWGGHIVNPPVNGRPAVHLANPELYEHFTAWDAQTLTYRAVRRVVQYQPLLSTEAKRSVVEYRLDTETLIRQKALQFLQDNELFQVLLNRVNAEEEGNGKPAANREEPGSSNNDNPLPMENGMSSSSDSITIDEWGPFRVKGNHAQHVDQDSHKRRVQYQAKDALTGEISRIEEYFGYYTKEQQKSILKKHAKSNCLVWFKAFKMIGEQPEKMKELEKKARENPPIRVRHHNPSEGSCSVKPLSPGCASSRKSGISSIQPNRRSSALVDAEAQRWWTLVRRAEPQMGWERFYDLFNQKYIPPSIRDSKSMEFQNLMQKPGMTVAQYEAEFTSLAHYAPHLIPDENMKAHRFEGGLNPDLRKLVKLSKLATDAEVLDWSLMLENENAKNDHMSEPKKRKNEDHNTSNGQTKRPNTGG
ncbi:hypothetical protein RHSIM_Rhsim10G0127900 [Rhododendron simsii]|uniref:Retrotransposon gag domain-containing protein n=1 Tax=Rhododendron simsii TaxID=118357 RepID=A0A834LDN1_RHOSS|nr:hypothetical protein RHSIM_Rhsim10G0127900 [Rhododendron simsii]